MLPVRLYDQPLTARQGERRFFSIVAKNDTGVIVNLVNCQVVCQVRSRSQILIASPITTITNAVTGQVILDFDSYQLIAPGEYFYDLRITNFITGLTTFTKPNPLRIYPVATVDNSIVPLPPGTNQPYEEVTITALGQTVFILSNNPDPLTDQVFFNGEKMDNGVDYTIAGNALTWLSDIVLDSTDNLEIYFV